MDFKKNSYNVSISIFSYRLIPMYLCITCWFSDSSGQILIKTIIISNEILII